MKNQILSSFARFSVLGMSLTAASLWRASAFAAPAKASGKKFPTAAKQLKKPTPGKPVKGLKVEGKGVATLQATFVRGSSNISGGAFTSIGRDDKYNNIVSHSNAGIENGYSVVVNFIEGRKAGDVGPFRSKDAEQYPESDEDKARRLKQSTTGIMMVFSAVGGFHAGQTIPVTILTYSQKPRLSVASMTLNEIVRIQGRAVVNGRGERKSTYEDRTRAWVADSGTLRIASVSPDKITFFLKNVHFKVIQPAQPRNAATGAFLLNGIGQSTFNEVD